jgi:hypothetical protein
MLFYPRILCHTNIYQECISFLCNLHGSFCSHKQRPWMFGSLHTTKTFIMLEVLHESTSLWIIFKHAYVIIMVFTKHVYGWGLAFEWFSFNALKWNFVVCQSICELFNVNQDNAMMTWFVEGCFQNQKKTPKGFHFCKKKFLEFIESTLFVIIKL